MIPSMEFIIHKSVGNHYQKYRISINIAKVKRCTEYSDNFFFFTFTASG